MYISKLFTMLIPRVSSFYKIIDNPNEKKKQSEFSKYITMIKIKYIMLILVIVISSILYIYFLISFCSVYKSTQLSWIQSTLISIAGNIIIYFIICLCISGCRFIAFRYNKEILFKIGQLIYDLV